MGSKIAVTIFIGLSCLLATSQAAVTLKVSGLAATVKNDLVELIFKADATLESLNVAGKNLAARYIKSFSLDWSRNGQGFFTPSGIQIVEQTAHRVHFYWVQQKHENEFNIELHYIMEDGLAGIYSYAKYRNDRNHTLSLGESRIIYRFDPKILTQGTNQQRSGTIPITAELNRCSSVQDNTWRFPNGSYYTKYDYADYIRKINYQGVYGHGFGAFVVSPSREYHGETRDVMEPKRFHIMFIMLVISNLMNIMWKILRFSKN